MSQTLKNVIVNAILKVSSDPAYAGREYASPDAAREDFTKALIELLFPENPTVPAVKERKKPGPKPKLDENGQPIKKAKSPKTVSPDSLASPVKEKKKPGPKPKLDENGEPIKKAKKAESPASSEPKEKKPRAPMSEEAKAAMVAKRKATMEAKKAAEPEAKSPAKSPAKTPKKETPALPASPPKAPKKAKKEKAAESPKKAKESPKKEKKAKESPKKATEPTPVNIDKFLPTQKKKVKEIVGDKVDMKDALAYLNGLSNAAFHDKKLEEHVRDYAASLKPAEPETQKQEMNLIEVEFDGETYGVDPETKRVYTVDENGNATGVGYAGMDGPFADMEVPEEDGDDE